MPNIPLPSGIMGSDLNPKYKEYLINLAKSENSYFRLPGISSFATGYGASRGAVTWFVDGIRYEVSGNNFISISSEGAVTAIGTIPGIADVVFSQGQVNLLILEKGGNGYTYNLTSGFSQITDPDFVPCVSADFIDGRHVMVPADGGPVIYSDIDNAASINSLSFFDAEELADKNKAVINISNQLYILGDGSAEIYKTTADPDNVFARREGSRVDVGFIGGLTKYKNSFMFIGKRANEKPKIFVMGAGDAADISNREIENILSSYTGEELSNSDVFQYTHNKIDFTGFNLPNHTIVFTGSGWVYQGSVVDSKKWRGKSITRAYDKYIVSDNSTNNIGTLSDDVKEYGSDTWAKIRTFIRSERGGHFSIKLIEADMSTGRKSPEESVGLAISKNAKVEGSYHYRGLGEVGDYEKRIKWHPPGGIGKFESYCGINFITTSDAEFNLDFLRFE